MIMNFRPYRVLTHLFRRYYSALDIPHGFFTVSIDDSPPQRLDGKNNGGQLAQQMIWSKTDLSPGRHTFTLTQDDVNGAFLDLDFLRLATSEVKR